MACELSIIQAKEREKDRVMVRAIKGSPDGTFQLTPSQKKELEVQRNFWQWVGEQIDYWQYLQIGGAEDPSKDPCQDQSLHPVQFSNLKEMLRHPLKPHSFGFRVLISLVSILVLFVKSSSQQQQKFRTRWCAKAQSLLLAQAKGKFLDRRVKTLAQRFALWSVRNRSSQLPESKSSCLKSKTPESKLSNCLSGASNVQTYKEACIARISIF